METQTRRRIMLCLIRLTEWSIKMKNTTQQPLQLKWTGTLDNSGKHPFGIKELSTFLWFAAFANVCVLLINDADEFASVA